MKGYKQEKGAREEGRGWVQDFVGGARRLGGAGRGFLHFSWQNGVGKACASPKNRTTQRWQ